MKKVLVWMHVVMLVVLACVVPCFADTWQEVTPDYGLPVAGNPMWGNASNNTHKVIEIVEKATALGMFGGAQPIYIYYQYSAANTNYHIMVAVPATSANGFYGTTSEARPKKSYYTMRIVGTNNQYAMTDGAFDIPAPWVLYTLQYDGDWGVTDFKSAGGMITTSDIPVGQQSETIFKRVAQWNTSIGDWTAPQVGHNNQDIVGWGVDATLLPGLQSIIDNYNEQIALLEHEHNDTPPVSYELDIADIFDSMFDGARDIFGGFDINLFGINILGVLIAVLVIAVIAFIVGKLWK